MYNDIISRIEDMIPQFSKGQKLIASYLLSNFERAAYMTASRLGDEAGVSESTVVRFAGEIGLSGEVRAVSRVDQRVAEAIRLGFTRIAVPHRCVDRLGNIPGEVKIIPVKTIFDLLPLMISNKNKTDA